MHLKSSPSSYKTMSFKILSLKDSSREPCPGEKGKKKIKVTDSNKYFFLIAFNFWELLHLAAGLEHNRKHCRICKALDLRWASKQEQPFELGKARAKKITWPQYCHLLKQNKDTAPFGFYI